MGEEQRFLERDLAARHQRGQRDTGQVLQPLQQLRIEGERHQAGAGFGNAQAELLRQAIAEIRRTHLGNGLAPRRHHQRATFQHLAR